MNQLLVDGHNLAWQSSYSAAKSDRNFANYTPETATEVVYGILNVLAPLVSPRKGMLGRHNIIVALDEGRNWRQLVDPSYKNGRGGTNNPATRFGAQIARLPAQLAKFGIRTVSVPTLEGDDVIALLAERKDIEGTKCILSKDKDLLAFVSDDVYCFNPSSKTLITPRNFGAYTQALFKTAAPLSPQNLPVFRALVGDTSDNLTGVPSCGPAYALQFVQHLEARGAVFTGYTQTPESLLAEVGKHAVGLPPAILHLGTPASLEALRHSFQLVQVGQAPAQRKLEVERLDVTPLPTPTYAQIKDALEGLNFQHFINAGEPWAAGLAQPTVAVAPAAPPFAPARPRMPVQASMDM